MKSTTETANFPFAHTTGGNLKSPDGDDWTTFLYPKTLIIGMNGVGKDAIIQNLQLALAKKVDGMSVGNGVTNTSSLIKLGVGDVGERDLWADATLELGPDQDCVKYRSELKERDGSVGQSLNGEWGGVPVVFPYAMVDEMLGFGVDKRRKGVLKLCGPYVTKADVLNALSADVRDDFEELLKEVRLDSLVEAVPAVAKLADVKMRAKNKDIARLVGEIGVIAQRLANMGGTDKELKLVTLREELATATANVKKAQKRVGESKVAEAKAEKAWKVFEANSAPVPPDFPHGDALRVLHYRAEDENGDVTCAACSAPDVNDDVYLQECIDWHTGELRAHAAAMKEYEAELAELYGVYKALAAGHGRAVAALDLAQREERDLQVQIDTLEEAGPSAKDELKKQLKAKKLERSDAAVAADGFKTLKQACNKAAVKLLQRCVDLLVAEVNEFLPADYRLGLQLMDGNRQACDFGFCRADGTGFSSELSGAEKFILRMSLCQAAGKMALNGRDGVLILTHNDVDLHPVRLLSLMETLTPVPHQIILMSTVGPGGYDPEYGASEWVPEGWGIVNADRVFSRTARIAPPEPAEWPEQVSGPVDDDGIEDDDGEVLTLHDAKSQPPVPEIDLDDVRPDDGASPLVWTDPAAALEDPKYLNAEGMESYHHPEARDADYTEDPMEYARLIAGKAHAGGRREVSDLLGSYTKRKWGRGANRETPTEAVTRLLAAKFPGYVFPYIPTPVDFLEKALDKIKSADDQPSAVRHMTNAMHKSPDASAFMTEVESLVVERYERPEGLVAGTAQYKRWLVASLRGEPVKEPGVVVAKTVAASVDATVEVKRPMIAEANAKKDVLKASTKALLRGWGFDDITIATLSRDDLGNLMSNPVQREELLREQASRPA